MNQRMNYEMNKNILEIRTNELKNQLQIAQEEIDEYYRKLAKINLKAISLKEAIAEIESFQQGIL